MNLIQMRNHNPRLATALALLVFLFILSAVAPVDAANYDPKKPLPHKQQVNSQPAGDEDPWDEDIHPNTNGSAPRHSPVLRYRMLVSALFINVGARVSNPNQERQQASRNEVTTTSHVQD